MKTNEKLNLTMLCDFYELTMGNGYFPDGKADRITYFDVFFRNVPDGGGFAIAAGLEQVVEYIRNLHFPMRRHRPISAARGIFCEGFLQYLREFPLHGRYLRRAGGHAGLPARADPDGPRPAIEAQLVGNVYFACAEPPDLIATKANRVVRAARGRAVMEFGSRRAQGAQAAILARALPTSAAATARPARSPISSTAYSCGHDGPFVGADVLQRI